MDTRICINLKQARELLDIFGGEDAEFILTEGEGHSGHGLYAFLDGHPEEGAMFLPKE